VTLRHFGARISDRFRLDDLRVVVLENELLRCTVLVDRGCDIIELLYKPKDVDFLWRLPQSARRSKPFLPTSYTSRPFLDHYEGGWQELFPHASAPGRCAGAELGFHGEVWGLPWEHEIVADTPEHVEVRFRVRTIRLPFCLERTISLRAHESVLRFHEVVVNEGCRELEFMWGHHPAFGPPFLDRHCVLDAPPCQIQVGDALHPFPVDSQGRDHRRLLPGKSDREVMKYLHEMKEGWVALTQPKKKLGIGLVFDLEVFPYVWLWHEFGYTQEYPWFGRAYVLGVEPFSSLPGARESGGRLLRLAGGAKLETDLLVVVYEATGVRRISRTGHVAPR
jgi:galactose mutarotase-like enzyme